MATEPLSEKDAADLAVRLVDLSLKANQFFVVISVAFGGYLLGSDGLISSAPVSDTRIVLAVIYGCSAGSMALGVVNILFKAKHALKIALEHIEDSSIAADRRRKLYSFDLVVTPIALGITWMSVMYLILFHYAS